MHEEHGGNAEVVAGLDLPDDRRGPAHAQAPAAAERVLLAEPAADERRDLDERSVGRGAAVRHLRVLVTEFQRLMGPVPEEEYDDIGPAPAGLAELSAEMCGARASLA